MAYREITMIEIKEVLRRWVSGIQKKRLAAQLGLDPKTVRRYVQVAEQCDVCLKDGLAGLTDDRVSAVIIALHGMNDYANTYYLAGPWFAERGVALYAYDARGFGRSPNRGLWPGERLMT